MKTRSSRLLALYGLFALLNGALGWLSAEDGGHLPFAVLAAVGAAAVVCSTQMQKASQAAFSAAPVIVALGLLAGLWYSVRGWRSVAAGDAGVFFPTVMFSLVCTFSAVLIPTVVRAWKLQQRFYNLFSNGRE